MTYQQQAEDEMWDAAVPVNPLAGLAVKTSDNQAAAHKPISDKQYNLIERLLDERDTTGIDVPEALDTLVGGWGGTGSQLIDALFAAPYAKSEQDTTEDADTDLLPGAGYFGVNGKRYKIDRPETGKWAGYLFFKTESDYHDQQRLGMARPGQAYQGKAADVFRDIMDDEQGAREEYARITGNCYVCNRKLEDPTSVALGIGPVCRS